MEDQLYGRVAFERFLNETQVMNNLQRIQKQLEPRFCRLYFLEFKDMSDQPALQSYLEEEAHFEQLQNALNETGTYHTFDEDCWVWFGGFVGEHGGALDECCGGWMQWDLDVYQGCEDCKDVIDESCPINRYQTLRNEIKNRFRGPSSLHCPAFNTHFPSRYSIFCDRTGNVEELNFLWSFVKRGGANVFNLPLPDVPYAAEECALCKRMGTRWGGGRVNCRTGWYAKPSEPGEQRKRKRSRRHRSVVS